MPYYHEGNKPYKVKLYSEVARMIMPQFMRTDSIIIAHDGVVYQRMKDRSLRRVDRETIGKPK